MSSWAAYSTQFSTKIRTLRLSLLEQTLLLVLLLVLGISTADAMYGRDIGNTDEIRMAKLQAQEELMALRPGVAQR